MASCETCLYWNNPDGTCRRHAPPPLIVQAGSNVNLVWPKTAPDAWCGEWVDNNESTLGVRRGFYPRGGL